ncbi:MAG: hypothetical protein N2322_05175, partial [Terrimicrobiaceae bacterium]|nr:hypothetical protein [Terrimicrobiaceae bacterium]
LLVVAVVAGAWIFGKAAGPAYRTVPVLDAAEYMENSNSLRGNVYRVEGEVLNLLAWSQASGRLVSVGVSDRVLPVLVTPPFNHINIQRGQRYTFLVEVDDKGVLRTRELKKT